MPLLNLIYSIPLSQSMPFTTSQELRRKELKNSQYSLWIFFFKAHLSIFRKQLIIIFFLIIVSEGLSKVVKLEYYRESRTAFSKVLRILKNSIILNKNNIYSMISILIFI